jgi:plastocyanin
VLGRVGAGVLGGQVLDPTGHAVAGAVAHVKSGLPPANYAAPKEPLVVDQRDKAFSPAVLPVLVGSTVAFRNSDPVLHNVYSRSESKTFDLGAYSGSQIKSTVFDKVGRVDVFCAIHTNMHTVVLVLDNPYFATTDARGYFEIKGLPDGSYAVAMWTDTRGEIEAQATVGAGRPGVVRAAFH